MNIVEGIVEQKRTSFENAQGILLKLKINSWKDNSNL